MLEPVKSVDIAALVCFNRQVLEKIARELGRDEEANEWKTLAERSGKAINELMWDEDEGFYFDVKGKSNEKLSCKSAAAFYTFLVDIPNERQTERLLEHLYNPNEFWTPCRFTIISKDWPGYAPGSYVHGVNSSHCNMVLLDGLGRQGRYDLIGELLDNWIHAYVRDGVPSNVEHLNPENGDWLHLDKMGYGGILVEPIIHYVCGITLKDDGQVEINPSALNPEWERLDFVNFNFRGHSLDVRWRKSKGLTVHLDEKLVSRDKETKSVLITIE